MPVTNADFEIAVRTTGNVSGVDQVRAALDDLKARTQTAHEATAAGAENAADSTKELGEALDQLNEGAGGALEPLAAMARFAGNPYLLALSGAIEVVKKFKEQNEQLRESMAKSVEASDKQAKLFGEAVAEGARAAAEKINGLIQAHEHVTASIDEATKALQAELDVTYIVTEAIQEQIDATVSLAEAKIKLGEAGGQASSVQTGAETGTSKHNAGAAFEATDAEQNLRNRQPILAGRETDAIQVQAEEESRRRDLTGRAQGGQASSADLNERREVQEPLNQSTLNGILNRGRQALAERNGPQRKNDVDSLLQEIMGVMDQLARHPAIANHDQITGQLRDIQSRLNIGSYPQ